MTTYSSGAPVWAERLKIWTTPGGHYWTNLDKLLSYKVPHILIAGATGSGKSVLINSMLYTALQYSPARKRFIFIDLKRVELSDYKATPHCLYYADTPQKAKIALDYACNIIENRYIIMQRNGVKQFSAGGYNQIYIVIDEYAELVTLAARDITRQLCRIAQIGRAAGVHIILATQRPTRDIITGQIKVNLDTRIALRCASAQDSRNIIDQPGAELLPRYGEALLSQYGYVSRIAVPLTPDEDIRARINWWAAQR